MAAVVFDKGSYAVIAVRGKQPGVQLLRAHLRRFVIEQEEQTFHLKGRLVDSTSLVETPNAKVALGILTGERLLASPAEQLAMAVLQGDQQAALLLADLVQEQYLAAGQPPSP